jgi:hypothetical protein
VTEVKEVEEPSETYFYNPERAIDLTDEMFEKCVKVMHILDNVELILKAVEMHD